MADPVSGNSDGHPIAGYGRLIGIARRSAHRAPMEEVSSGTITLEAGLIGDHKGLKFPKRAITVLAKEDWLKALAELESQSAQRLNWTARRANLFVEGIVLPKGRGGVLRVGPVLLEVTYPTQPCQRMDEAHPGLLKALHPDWRGGVTCRVLEPGAIRLGDAVEVVADAVTSSPRLPG